ncbi:complement factor D [Parambassis ranga]|uniref:trypsin n=1 Tax=Parambassis ranga TaxID=210632 RepID=A0A6P7H9K0_9TELE|nr:complement factor D-like [Parambassis ranga]
MAADRGVLLGAAVFVVALVSLSEGILGGREATPHSRPYMASIQVPEGARLKHECGGFVIADQWVMTAAHCLPNGAQGRVVVLGVHSLSQPEDTKQTFNILEVHIHPQFTIVNYNNDIALIKLDRVFNATEAVGTVQFLRAGGTDPPIDAEVDTAGWGSLDDLQTRPDTLREVVVKVFNPKRCGRSDYYGSKFTSNMMCAFKLCPNPCPTSFKKEDTCDGDSGGPLLYNGVVVGITSNGGAKCGQLKKPGIYTVVSHYTEWIDNTMGLQAAAAPQDQE